MPKGSLRVIPPARFEKDRDERDARGRRRRNRASEDVRVESPSQGQQSGSHRSGRLTDSRAKNHWKKLIQLVGWILTILGATQREFVLAIVLAFLLLAISSAASLLRKIVRPSKPTVALLCGCSILPIVLGLGGLVFLQPLSDTTGKGSGARVAIKRDPLERTPAGQSITIVNRMTKSGLSVTPASGENKQIGLQDSSETPDRGPNPVAGSTENDHVLAAQSCPEGFTNQGGQCVESELECPPGYENASGQCLVAAKGTSLANQRKGQ